MNQDESNQIEQSQKPSLVQRLIKDPIQWIANMYVVIGAGANTVSLYHCSQADCGGSSGIEPVTLTLGILSLAYTIDNVISHYQGRERTHIEDFIQKKWQEQRARYLQGPQDNQNH